MHSLARARNMKSRPRHSNGNCRGGIGWISIGTQDPKKLPEGATAGTREGKVVIVPSKARRKYFLQVRPYSNRPRLPTRSDTDSMTRDMSRIPWILLNGYLAK